MTEVQAPSPVGFPNDSEATLLWAARYVEREDTRKIGLLVINVRAARAPDSIYRKPGAGWTAHLNADRTAFD